MTVNYTQAFLLLSVIEKAVAHGPAFTDLVGEAGFELAKINADAASDGLARAKIQADADAERASAIAAEQNAAAAEQAQKLRAVSEESLPGPDATATTDVERRI